MIILSREIGEASFELLKGTFLTCAVGACASTKPHSNMSGSTVYLSATDGVDLPPVAITLTGIK
jgi:hypothetical protein